LQQLNSLEVTIVGGLAHLCRPGVGTVTYFLEYGVRGLMVHGRSNLRFKFGG
jgi:hypothetical protein